MDLSIVIPAKNESVFLNKSLPALWESIKKSGCSAEIILVDNESDDDSAAIALFFGCQVVLSQKRTIAGLRNVGALAAKGKYLAFLDADCIVHSDWVATCITNLEEDGIGATGTKVIPSNDMATWVSWAWFLLAAGSKRGQDVSWLGTSNLMLKKKIFLLLGGFNEELQTAEDVDFCSRLTANKKIRLEKRFDTIHLREPTTLKELFFKEIWRGKSSFKCFAQNGYRLKELPSIAIPFLVNILVIICLSSIFISSPIISILYFPILFFPLILMVKKGVPFLPLNKAAQVYVVAFTFIIARSIALLNEVFSLLPRIILYKR